MTLTLPQAGRRERGVDAGRERADVEADVVGVRVRAQRGHHHARHLAGGQVGDRDVLELDLAVRAELLDLGLEGVGEAPEDGIRRDVLDDDVALAVGVRDEEVGEDLAHLRVVRVARCVAMTGALTSTGCTEVSTHFAPASLTFLIMAGVSGMPASAT